MEVVFIDVPYKLKKIQAVLTSPSPASASPSSADNATEKINAMVILTHGAGGDMNSEQLCFISKRLVDAGLKVLRFTCKPPNFGYRLSLFNCFGKKVIN